MSANDVSEVTTEAIEILRIAGRLRAARPVSGTEELSTHSAAPFAARPAPFPRGEPASNDTAERAFEKAIRWWAVRAAVLLGYDDWERMVWAASDAVPDFKGSAVSRFERRFEGLRLKDGALVVP